MTPDRLNQIETSIARLAALRSAATPGKWTTHWDLIHPREVRSSNGQVVCTLDPGWSPEEEAQAERDAEWICEARNYSVEEDFRTMAEEILRLWWRTNA